MKVLKGSSDLLREIEQMTAELGDRTADFGRELAEVAAGAHTRQLSVTT